MKKYLFIAAAALLSASCFHVNVNFKDFGGTFKNAIKGEGPVETRELGYQDFHTIRVNGHADITFVQSEQWKVSLTTQENIFEALDYEVIDSVLVIQAEGGRSVKAEEYDLYIQAPWLKQLEVNGAADFKADSPLKSDRNLLVEVNGAAEIDFPKGITCGELVFSSHGASDIEAHGLDVGKLTVQIDGAGDVTVSGKAGEAQLNVNGAGDIDAKELQVAGELKKKASGAARIRL